MPPAIGAEFAIEAIAQQRIVVRIRFEINVAAVSAIATRRSAARDILLPPERHTAVSAVAAFDPNFGFINKHGALVCR